MSCEYGGSGVNMAYYCTMINRLLVSTALHAGCWYGIQIPQSLFQFSNVIKHIKARRADIDNSNLVKKKKAMLL
jgi:hypothetical protein